MVNKQNLDISINEDENVIRIDYMKADVVNIIIYNRKTNKTVKRTLRITKNNHVFLN